MAPPTQTKLYSRYRNASTVSTIEIIQIAPDSRHHALLGNICLIK